jgi:predicted Zn-dependent protease
MAQETVTRTNPDRVGMADRQLNQGVGRRIGRGWLAAVLLAGGLSAGCQTVQTTQAGAVGVDRTQRMSSLVSEAEMQKGAAQAYQQVMAKERSQGNLNTDPALTERVRGIAKRIIPATAAFRPDAPGWNWEVNVIRSDQVNAWVMPGGKIAIYSGIIERLKLNDDEIAAIMGHEVAHALREHARERASEQQVAGLGIAVGAAILGLGQAGTDLAGMAYQVSVGMPNSRAHEVEADRIGVELAARAGYDPRAAVSLWQKMQAQGGARQPQWLSTHPSTGNRLKDLEAYSARVMPLYEQARKR